jgi:shikimate dehydrogenase
MTRPPLAVGLIGYPVEHSLSPAFQQAAFDALGIPARYELWPTPPESLDERFRALRSPGVLGANVTVPHKRAAFARVDHVAGRARRAGAVNTVVNRDGVLYGDNTDVPGFLAPLRERGLPLAELAVVVLGAGGAARGILVALGEVGCRQVTVANRTAERAHELAVEFGVVAAPLDQRLAPHLARADLLVNATSVGWDGASLPLDATLLDALPATAIVYDLTYHDTPLLQAARRRGLETIDGLGMLVHQGAESFRLWTGQEPPLEVMWRAALAARQAREQAAHRQ